jgi:hypothetical protein
VAHPARGDTRSPGRGDAHVTLTAEALSPLPAGQLRATDGVPLWEFVAASGLASVVACASKNPNPKLTVLLVRPGSRDPVLAVKVPMTDQAARAVDAEAQALADMSRLTASAPAISATIPRVLGKVDFNGRPGIVMTATDGIPMSTAYLRWRRSASRSRVAADFAAVGRWLAEFQGATAQAPGPLDMDGGVAATLRRRFASEERVHGDVDLLRAIYERLNRVTVPRTAMHGDLWGANILLSRDAVSGVVDWEAGAESGEPMRDLVRFALMYAQFLDRRTRPGRRVRGHRGLRAGAWGATVEYALDGSGWFPDLFRGFLAEGLARLGATPSCWRDCALAGIAEVAATADEDGFARRHLELFRRLAQQPGAASPRREGA